MDYEEVELENGVVAFEGNVLELFTSQGSNRVPVSQIRSLDVQPSSLTVNPLGYLKPMTIPLSGDESESSELNDLLELVRGNALNMDGN